MVMTTIRFKDKEELAFYQEQAKKKYNLDFSKFIRMLVKEDLEGKKKNVDQKEEENKIIDQLKMENKLLKKEISLLKDHITLLFDLNTNKILQKIQDMSTPPEQTLQHEKTILDMFQESKKLSLTQISTKTGISEKIVVRILDELIGQEKVRLYQDMRYGGIK